MTEWQPPKDVKPWMVCAAAMTPGGHIISGPRHFDSHMRHQLSLLWAAMNSEVDAATMCQGFIDQWGRFYTREEAMACVKDSGQPFNKERNGDNDRELYSEGLY